MKKFKLVFAGIIFLGCSLFGQSWIASNKLWGDANISAIQTTSGPDGKVVSLGFFSGTLNEGQTQLLTTIGARDYFVVKYTELGEIEWIRQLGSTGNEYVLGGICASYDGNVYVSGGFRNDLFYTPTNSIPSTGGWDIFLAKYDPDGTPLWCKNIGSGFLNQRPNAVKVDKSGNLIVGGFFSDSIFFDQTTTLYSDDGVDDYFYSKFNADGDFLWAKQIRSFETTRSGRIYSIDATDNGYYFGGLFADSTIFENDTIVSHNNSFDIHVFKTSLDGDVEWIRNIGGKGDDQTVAIVADVDENVYLSGYYFETDSLFIDDNETDTVYSIGQNKGDFDFLTAKYDLNGDLQWYKTAGGKGGDKLNDISLNTNQVIVSGYFTDTLMWGGIEVATAGLSDVDMFVGEFDSDGNFRTANSYGGTNNSFESARSVFYEGDVSYTILRSNSTLLVLGDSIYTSPGGIDYIVFGTIGCLPISVDNTIYNDVETCFGDSTGSIQISATGGFGDPWVYSIDNGLTSTSSPFFGDLPAGDYQVVVVDEEGCAQTGPLVTLTEPDTLLATVDLLVDILHHTKWSGAVEVTEGTLTVIATGGSGSYSYQLLPGVNPPQGIGTFTFALEDSGRYVVAVNDTENCGPSETDSVDINVVRTGGQGLPIGIEGFDGIEVKIYPNPTSGIITLEMPYDKSECPLEVINMTGQVVLREQIYPSSGMISETIDLSAVPKGLYMLRIDGRSLKSAIVVK